ncbi:ArdC-like ssDNA-binding domain-containing protein [Sinomonas sp. ASV322]|uniref:ArdC-like ssDNA-binding domain-containing protein n=1 Tax=Sinomonas sp. ASV322 TaxID=3041920 RepID=UPI0027DB6EB3|nr:ArdC-like ssDNA-binding domain-containing protein [Sinomonas sp. ASV322]MDQ4504411.1 ArdC-like ssDNA-binding domain-containing protein [Sinomonas sp. ASV322]
MARKVTTRKSPEERRAQAEALQASIAEQVEELRGSEQWQLFLDFARSFHSYSLSNVLLILAQCPTATRVAGFRQWQEKGRQVRKGEKAIRIFGFRQKKVTDEEAPEGEEDAETNEKGERVVTYYPVLSVFDISQTDLTDPEAGDPSQIARRLEGEEPRGILAAAADWLTGQGWSFEREQIPGSVNGYTTTDGTRRVVVDADLSPAQAAKTALHEAAHVILHAEEDHAEYVQHRGIKETEAESVAYVVAGLLGLDTTAYSIGYVAGWSQGEAEAIKGTAARVLRAAHTLADAITAPAEPGEDAA